MEWQGDSPGYDFLLEAAQRAAHVPGISCEIGLRDGMGSKTIVDGLAKADRPCTHIAIDPYGLLDYRFSEDVFGPSDYSDAMRDAALSKLYPYAGARGVNFLFFCMMDSEFFHRFWDGVPVYVSGKPELKDLYRLVYFDGPHSLKDVFREVHFFIEHMASGAVFVFDDVDKYEHLSIHDFLLGNDWRTWKVADYGNGAKASYVKR